MLKKNLKNIKLLIFKSGDCPPILLDGKEVSADSFIEVEYFDEAQKDLFDYTFKDGVITVYIKDIDLYNALEAKDSEGIREDIKEGTEAYQKLAKYVKDPQGGDMLGLKVKLYFKGDVSKMRTDYVFSDGSVSFLQLDEDKSSTEYPVYKDEKGTYLEMIYGGTLAHYYVEYWFNGSRHLGISFPSWNNGEFIIRNYADDAKLVSDDEMAVGFCDYSCESYTKLAFKYVLAETTAEDKETGVTVSAKKEVDAKLNVTPINKDEQVYTELSKRLSNKEIVSAYEIELDGSYTGDIDVTFTLGKENDGKIATILHKKDNGEIETFERKVQDGKVTVTTKELSPWMIALAKEETPNVSQNANDNDTTTPSENNQNPTTSGPSTTNKGEKDDTPKTGVEDFTLVVIAGVILSTILLAVALKRD